MEVAAICLLSGLLVWVIVKYRQLKFSTQEEKVRNGYALELFKKVFAENAQGNLKEAESIQQATIFFVARDLEIRAANVAEWERILLVYRRGGLGALRDERHYFVPHYDPANTENVQVACLKIEEHLGFMRRMHEREFYDSYDHYNNLATQGPLFFLCLKPRDPKEYFTMNEASLKESA